MEHPKSYRSLVIFALSVRSCRPYEDLWDMIPRDLLHVRFSYMYFFFSVPCRYCRQDLRDQLAQSGTRSADLCRLRIRNRVYSTVFRVLLTRFCTVLRYLGGTTDSWRMWISKSWTRTSTVDTTGRYRTVVPYNQCMIGPWAPTI